MFATFINDLVIEINILDLGITVGERRVSLLVYADDIDFTASSENDLQTMLKWKMASFNKHIKIEVYAFTTHAL